LKHNFILFFEFFENFPKIIALFKSKINVNSLFKFPPPPINLKKGKKKKKKLKKIVLVVAPPHWMPRKEIQNSAPVFVEYKGEGQ